MQNQNFLAFDIGASNGRAILGTLANDKIELIEIHRFDNQMVELDGHYVWDVDKLYREIVAGLTKCVNQYQITPHCIGIDTWGVDFGLFNYSGQTSGKPLAYRDSITDNAIEEVSKKIPLADLYAKTGIQLMKFNTLFQLWSLKRKYPEKLLSADRLLFIPDLLSFYLTGISYTEYTIASTSQMLSAKTGDWDMNLLHKLGLPTHVLEEIVSPGNVIGNIKAELQAELGIGPVPVAAVAAHDTASAIAAIPAVGKNWAYLSSGTWSLLGVELDEPCLNKKAYEYSFTNEGGVGGKIRFLKNINGLWLLQECKKIWDQDKNYSYSELSDLSLKAKGFRSLIDPDAEVFLNPENMITAIQDFCKATDQEIPGSVSEITRTIFDSLAIKYKITLDQLMDACSKEVEKIHIIGGGSQNQVLCQFTANATGLEVISGPTEGTAMGNILVQAKALGIVENLSEMRKIVSNTIVTKTYYPLDAKQWKKGIERYNQIILHVIE